MDTKTIKWFKNNVLMKTIIVEWEDMIPAWTI
jgi:hypothetical protein